MLERVEKSIVSRRLLARGDRVLVAVSGGLDSIVLLHLLATLAPRHNWKLAVAHLNHMLRGKEADADQRLVARTAAKRGLPFQVATADVKQHARARKESFEMAARVVRHDFLARTARSLGIGKVALAHHADDQAELFLLRLLRGAGSDGLAGMDWQGVSPADAAITLVRPLLDERKDDLLAYAREHRLPFREDATNACTDILRNRIRRRLLPLLRRSYQPGIDAVLRRESDMLREEARHLADEARRWIKSRRPAFDLLSIALQRRALQIQSRTAGLVLDYDQIERLRRRPMEWIAVAGATCRRTTGGKIEVRNPEASPQPRRSFETAQRKVALGECRTVTFHGVQFRWREHTRRLAHCPNRECFDADAVGKKIILRHWRPGDRFHPIGLPGPVKLQDLFVNLKVPRERRHELIVAANGAGEIFWVEGLRISDPFKVTDRTRRVLIWQWTRLTA